MLTYWDLPRRINKDEVQPEGLKSNKQEIIRGKTQLFICASCSYLIQKYLSMMADLHCMESGCLRLVGKKDNLR